MNTSLQNIKFDASLVQLTDSFYYSELTSLNERLSSPKWTAIVDSLKTWVIPVNLDYHWSLILLKKRTNEIVIECWDSLPTKFRLDKIKSQLITSYDKNLFGMRAFSISYNHECYIQKDFDNCGIFLIGNIFAFIYNKKPCNLDSRNSRIATARMILSALNL